MALALSILNAGPASASSMGYGLLLSNYTSGFTASTIEQGDPSCVNNQGAPGSASETDGPGTASNIDVEFTTQNIGDCQFGNNSWVYPFVLTVNGYTSSTWNLVSAHNTTNNCPTGSSAVALTIGLAGLTPCVTSMGSGDIGVEASYTGQPAVLMPPASYGFYAVMTPSDGPAGTPDAQQPWPAPCTAGNWHGCVSIEVYDNGQEPYAAQTATPTATSTATGAGAATLTTATRTSAAKATPSLSKPIITKVKRGGHWRVRVEVTGTFNTAPPALTRTYPKRQLRSAVHVAVRAVSADEHVLRTSGHTKLRVQESPSRATVTMLFSAADSAAILRELREQRPVVFAADGFQLTSTANETFVTESRSAQTTTRPL